MDIISRLNAAIDYLESNLVEEVKLEEAARLCACSVDGFSRTFSYLSGVSITEYIRKRRLTQAAIELQGSNCKVIDVAMKYGYNSSDAFSRAFVRQHGVTPSAARDPQCPLIIYPPISFHIAIKGATEMNYRIMETEAIVLKGLSKQFTGNAADRFAQEHIMWADDCDDVQNKVCTTIPGTWYGVWESGTYWIAKKADECCTEGLDEVIIPGDTYAVFKTGRGGFEGDEFLKLHTLIFDSWLQTSEYRQSYDREIEVYHLFPKDEKHKRFYELWVPVVKV
ncbi:AraC family transcriptional regulator [Clostridia bacterium]|nr:AraC family transcriptional regulator [Clostridia bacterium]